jgi:hypothetical protein
MGSETGGNVALQEPQPSSQVPDRLAVPGRRASGRTKRCIALVTPPLLSRSILLLQIGDVG